MDKIAKWYRGLHDLEQIIVEEHVCATDPRPLDSLASELHTFRHVIHRRRNDLPQSLQDVIEEDAGLRHAVAVVEREIAHPVIEEDLTSRYPQLAVEVTDDGGLTVLDLLCGLIWPGSRRDGWVFDGDIQREQQKTLDALNMEPDETMALGTAERLLRDAGVRIGSEQSRLRRWLARSGLLVMTHQVVSLSTDPRGVSASHALVSRDAAPASITSAKVPHQHYTDVESGTPHEEHGDVADPLWGALARLRALYVEQGVVDDLGTFLLNAERLQGELQQLARQVSGAYVGEDGRWCLGVGDVEVPVPATSAPARRLGTTPDSVVPTVCPDSGVETTVPTDQAPRTAQSNGATRPGDAASTAPAASDTTVMDTVESALVEAGHPLSTQDLRHRCAPTRRLTPLRRELDADIRFHRSDRDTWALSEWGMPVYKPLRELVADMVDEAGGAVPSYEVIKKLTRDFTIKESSVRQTMSSAPFTSRGGVVRRLSDVGPEQRRWQQPTSKAASVTADHVPSAVELMKDMGLDF
ncbi:hypothetical protein [Streptomyces rugosispiralis]|uniref:Uncharacterized protein n=1 Tax=Streptomyces rugosispiralis TaxID=2967341 RepID=A0ABT1V6Y1_9ACTN|nr:hypothetical protein [Streptomyces rugosispiralis]MCQ8193143.1 hypothetical protein [Streptomyces rugosispiralis]